MTPSATTSARYPRTSIRRPGRGRGGASASGQGPGAGRCRRRTPGVVHWWVRRPGRRRRGPVRRHLRRHGRLRGRTTARLGLRSRAPTRRWNSSCRSRRRTTAAAAGSASRARPGPGASRSTSRPASPTASASVSAGQGGQGTGDAPSGDLYLVVRIAPHARYRVEGRDLHVDLPLAPWEAALGTSVVVDTPGRRGQGPGSAREPRRDGACGSAAEGCPTPGAVPVTCSPTSASSCRPSSATAERELFEELARTSTFDPRRRP